MTSLSFSLYFGQVEKSSIINNQSTKFTEKKYRGPKTFIIISTTAPKNIFFCFSNPSRTMKKKIKTSEC